ncbi:WXG100 family type VII secretion target [Mycobacteroides abscessus subsp. abscessus]|uniref:WXG100 family type VII secretion target n=1 Tax=Mycobacteroides abscessus TaxID=36809 RepID=UPI00092BB962|nr:WXG100 family type VII secretion target [Mycobacteroides abscessus]SHX99874.1 WXG100 family type VII secretion target [Mycobacteroides abscessus subsp. abscessus]SIC81994.1 WXG100 family type VII secretion target [Mycobacteroides abscessus subsp. abscessus]SKK31038.1 WXG100 family type VII secretion target [Mycobacteroides abscessus subsp. abscessus]SKP24651.1 WXG100 family type VII secretion target [Mycobacteroides abscessus subsp. abscessus]
MSGAGGRLEADHSQIANAVSVMDEKITGVRNGMNNVDRAIAESKSTFQGPAADMLNKTAVEWGEVAAKLEKALRDIHEATHTSNTTLQAEVQDQVQQFQQVASAAGGSSFGIH